jgi:hypothetical protein
VTIRPILCVFTLAAALASASPAPNQAQISSGRYVSGSGFAGWVVGTTTGTGKPAVAADTNGVVYVAIRYANGSYGMSRLAGNTRGHWYVNSRVMPTEPQTAATGGRMYLAAMDALGRAFATATIAALRGEFYIVGRDVNTDVLWYRSGAGWTYYGNRGQSASSLVVAPR